MKAEIYSDLLIVFCIGYMFFSFSLIFVLLGFLDKVDISAILLSVNLVTLCVLYAIKNREDGK